jgi:hypothetical protein
MGYIYLICQSRRCIFIYYNEDNLESEFYSHDKCQIDTRNHRNALLNESAMEHSSIEVSTCFLFTRSLSKLVKVLNFVFIEIVFIPNLSVQGLSSGYVTFLYSKANSLIRGKNGDKIMIFLTRRKLSLEVFLIDTI